MNEHEDIARRLREEGEAKAPPDLADAVMAQVRAEPRRAEPRAARARRPPRWRPMLGWAAAAAALVAIGFGIAHLPTGTSSSSSSSSAASVGAERTARQGAVAGPENVGPGRSRAYTLSGAQLGDALRKFDVPHATTAEPGRVFTIRVPADRYQALARQLRGLQKAYLASPHGRRMLVRLVRAGTR